MTKRLSIGVTLAMLTGVAFFQGCSPAPSAWPDKPGIKVLASFPPLYCFAQAIVGDDGTVMCLTTAKIHGAEWSPQDVLKVRGANLIISNGLELDDKYIDALKKSANKSVDAFFEVGEQLGKSKLLEMGHDHGEAGHDDHGHEHGEYDPHVWLSLDRAMLMVDLIAARLGEVDKSKKETFSKRAGDYKAKLKELKEYGLARFKDLPNRKIVTQHESLRYFAKDFNLEIVGSIRSQAGQVESEKHRADLVDNCKKAHAKVICFEPQFSTADADALKQTLKSQKVDVGVAMVDPLESVSGGHVEPGFYLEQMRKNIDNLAEALK